MMNLEIIYQYLIDSGTYEIEFLDYDGNKQTRIFEYWRVWKEGENTEISLFKSECTEYNIWVETSMGEANEDSKIIKIDDK
jgi:hypothetical protein